MLPLSGLLVSKLVDSNALIKLSSLAGGISHSLVLLQSAAAQGGGGLFASHHNMDASRDALGFRV